ncbi:conserved protein of unknown function [Xenorhabdus bovienii]|uniref:Uncharacterized protein n=1 Tax=Xenorhabdus bovienii TaxID=40576 RepID=A0A0B6XDA9_XENBV|nr:conserved protein of unknown function [Xenorhabdus bovienii]
MQNTVDIFGGNKSAVAARTANITVNGERLSDVDAEIFKPWGNGMLDDNGQLIIDADNLKALPDGHRWQSIPFTRTRNGDRNQCVNLAMGRYVVWLLILVQATLWTC